jgi:NosR/NirI family transcriptional regulator, nitrous oxide reductase regulator
MIAPRAHFKPSLFNASRAWLVQVLARWLANLGVLLCMLVTLTSPAATLTRTQLQIEFGASYQVGERLTALPVWPVYHVGQTAAGYNALYAYVFETIDIEPVAGYGGKPINILVVMNPAGKYLDIRMAFGVSIERCDHSCGSVDAPSLMSVSTYPTK